MKGGSTHHVLGFGLIHAVPGDTQANKTQLISFQVFPVLSWYLCFYTRNVFCSALVVLLDL